MRLEKYIDSSTFFSEFEKSVNKSRSADAKINEKEKLNYMMNTLPSHFSYIGDLIGTLKEENQTISYRRSLRKLARFLASFRRLAHF